MEDSPVDLRPEHLDLVSKILREHVPEREVWAFGSRVSGTAKKTSDLDLCIVGPTPLAPEVLASLRQSFSESDLPMKVDVVDWASTEENFRTIIASQKRVIQSAASGR